MNDYLSRLAARTLGTVELLKPRLPSLFEPPSVGQATWPTRLIGPDNLVPVQAGPLPHQFEAAERSSPPDRGPYAAATTRPDTPAYPVPTLNDKPVRSPLIRRPAVEPGQHVPAQSFTSQSQRPSTTREPLIPSTEGHVSPSHLIAQAVPVEHAANEPARSANIAQPHTWANRAPEIEPDQNPGRAQVVPAPQIAPEPPVTSVVRTERRDRSGNPVYRVEIVPAPVLETQLALSQTKPEQESPASQAVRPAPAHEVHVHIGRIEVRAVNPPAIPEQRQQATPVESLQQYLKRSRGGNR
jgi:hypothetical protein